MDAGSPKLEDQQLRPHWRSLRRLILGMSILYGLFCLVGSELLLTPPPRVPTVGGSGDRRSPDRVGSAEFHVDEVHLPEGLRLPLWWASPSAEPAGCVMLFHGRGGVYAEDRMRFVLASGRAVVALDFRAHGQAPGDSSGFGYTEQEEVRATLAWTRQRWPRTRIVAWGRSMGAAAILFAADRTRELAGVILESPYSSLERALRNRFEMHFPSWLYPLCQGPVLLGEIRSGLWLDRIQPVRQISRFRADRVLLVQGALDQRVQQDEYEGFLAALPGLPGVVLKGLGHADFFRSGGDSYRARILGRLSEWLTP